MGGSIVQRAVSHIEGLPTKEEQQFLLRAWQLLAILRENVEVKSFGGAN